MTRSIRTSLIAALVGCFFVAAAPTYALDIVISDTDAGSEIEDMLRAEFSNIGTVEHSNFANYPAGGSAPWTMAAPDLVIIGRSLSSAAYSSGKADGYNSMAIPMISFTSYVSRTNSGRLGWHSASASNNRSVAGDETTVTADGAAWFGVPAGTTLDLWDTNGGGTFNGLGLGTVGDGVILATIGGDIQAAYWETGDAPGNTAEAGVATFPAPRLLFNLDNDDTTDSPKLPGVPNAMTAEGMDWLQVAGSKMGLIPVPEPSSLLLVLSALGLLAVRTRRR